MIYSTHLTTHHRAIHANYLYWDRQRTHTPNIINTRIYFPPNFAVNGLLVFITRCSSDMHHAGVISGN